MGLRGNGALRSGGIFLEDTGIFLCHSQHSRQTLDLQSSLSRNGHFGGSLYIILTV